MSQSNFSSSESNSSSSSSSTDTVTVLQELSSAASSGSLEEVDQLLKKTLVQSESFPSSILGLPLRLAIEGGNEAAARLILTHNSAHVSEYAKSDSWYQPSPTIPPFQTKREHQLESAMAAALQKGMHGLLASIKEAGLETTGSSFAAAIGAPTESDRFLGLSTAVNLWGFPSGEAFVDLIDTVLPADAPQCLEFIMQQQALEDGEDMQPGYAKQFIEDRLLSDTNRQLLQRIIKEGH